MRTLNYLTDRAKWLVPGGVAVCLLLLAFDLVAFWAFGRRPVISTLETNTFVWSLLIGSAATYAARWVISGEPRVRHALAATLAAMVLVSATHPWMNGLGRDGETPVAPTLMESAAHDAVVFSGGPLSEADHW